MQALSHRFTWLLIGGCLAMTGCASTSGGNPLDPFEATNRRIDAFNDSVDQAVLRPVAKTYFDYTPTLLQTTGPRVLMWCCP